jgi:hypothetical protein
MKRVRSERLALAGIFLATVLCVSRTAHAEEIDIGGQLCRGVALAGGPSAPSDAGWTFIQSNLPGAEVICPISPVPHANPQNWFIGLRYKTPAGPSGISDDFSCYVAMTDSCGNVATGKTRWSCPTGGGCDFENPNRLGQTQNDVLALSVAPAASLICPGLYNVSIHCSNFPNGTIFGSVIVTP